MGKQARRRKQRREQNAKARELAPEPAPESDSPVPWWQVAHKAGLVGALICGGGMLLFFVLNGGLSSSADSRVAATPPDARSAARSPSTVNEREPNDDATSAQMIPTLPVTISGSLSPGESDVFAVQIEHNVRLLDAFIDAPATAELMISRDGSTPTMRGTAPLALMGAGLAKGRAFVVVRSTGGDNDGEPGSYTLRLDERPWNSTREFEPNDNRRKPGSMTSRTPKSHHPDAWAPTIQEQRVTGHISHREDIDCHRIELKVPATGAVLHIKLAPHVSLTPRLVVLDPSGNVVWTASAKTPGEVLEHPALGGKSWQSAWVACVTAAEGAGEAARYQLEVKSLAPKHPLEFEPNAEKKSATALPRNVPVAGYLTQNDLDWYRISAGKPGKVTLEVKGVDKVSIEVVARDINGAELTQQIGAVGAGVRIAAPTPVFVTVRAVSGHNHRTQYTIVAEDATGLKR